MKKVGLLGLAVCFCLGINPAFSDQYLVVKDQSGKCKLEVFKADKGQIMAGPFDSKEEGFKALQFKCPEAKNISGSQDKCTRLSEYFSKLETAAKTAENVPGDYFKEANEWSNRYIDLRKLDPAVLEPLKAYHDAAWMCFSPRMQKGESKIRDDACETCKKAKSDALERCRRIH